MHILAQTIFLNMLDIEKAFNPETKSVHSHYQSPGVGFYIPLYQREYSWDNANIDQLLDDLSRGVENMIDNPKDEIRFLGTIIAVKVMDKRSIYPRDPQGLPSSIENIIDGQQRLSTIALFATILHKSVSNLQKRLKAQTDEEVDLINQLEEACNFWKNKLLDIFSLDLQRGNPYRKPKIIRGNRDQWTKEGKIEENYLSDVAHYLARYIAHIELGEELPKPDRSSLAGRNLTRIDRWLKRAVLNAHVNESGDFLPAWQILKEVDQENIWQYERPALLELVFYKEHTDKKSLKFLTNAIVQLFSVCHYLLDRCCFTIIQPMNEDWAFDMFQSLNATGTPLTAIETFKPTVVNITDIQDNTKYKDSDAEKSFEKVDYLFADSNSASQKSKLATDFLTSFAITAAGYKLESHFSKQRKWLDEIYRNTGKEQGCQNYQEQCDFIHFFGNYAKFYKDVWLDYKGENGMFIPGLAGTSEAELASLLLLYLKDSNHKMSITVLGRFYKDVIDGKEDSITTFIQACKLIAAFYTLWRSADSNAGLDNVYRHYFKGDDETIKSNAWIRKRLINLAELKSYLQHVLEDKGIGNKESWLKKAKTYLRYNKAKPICRFALFVSAHETIPDPAYSGLMKIGKPGTDSYFTLSKWNSDDLKTIEHIAPQGGEENWDERLYEENELYQSIGNLTLLPSKVNTSAGNRGWLEKHLYYQHLSEGDPQKQQELANKAKSKGINLSKETVQLLQEANFNAHIKPIVRLGEEGNWNLEFINKRAERMLNILWERIEKWVF